MKKNKKFTEKPNRDVFGSDSNRQKGKSSKDAYNLNNNNNLNSNNVSPYNNINTIPLNNQNNVNISNIALSASNMQPNQPSNNNIPSNNINQDDLNKYSSMFDQYAREYLKKEGDDKSNIMNNNLPTPTNSNSLNNNNTISYEQSNYPQSTSNRNYNPNPSNYNSNFKENYNVLNLENNENTNKLMKQNSNNQNNNVISLQSDQELRNRKYEKQAIYKNYLDSQISNRSQSLGKNYEYKYISKKNTEISSNPFSSKNYEFGKSNLNHNPILNPSNNYGYNRYIGKDLSNTEQTLKMTSDKFKRAANNIIG